MPVLMLWSLEDGTLWTDSCPRLLATMATALNLLRVPELGLLAFCRLSLSSVLRLMDRWSVQTNDTCILSQRMHDYHRENSMKEWSLQKTNRSQPDPDPLQTKLKSFKVLLVCAMCLTSAQRLH